jgi:superfamily II DNA or RNA helicase
MATDTTNKASRLFNFRKMRQDFSPNLLSDGKQLFEQDAVLAAKLISMDGQSMRFSGKVLGSYDNTYECELELERGDSEVVDSNCDCSYKYDCQHLAAMLFHLEENLDQLMVVFSREASIEERDELEDEEKEEIRAVLKKAVDHAEEQRDHQFREEILQESVHAADIMGRSPFFLPEEKLEADKAELGLIIVPLEESGSVTSIQLALRLPYRSKPLNVPNIEEFLESVRYREPISIGGRKYLFNPQSFAEEGGIILKMLLDNVRFYPGKGDRTLKVQSEPFGMLLARAYDLATARASSLRHRDTDEESIPCLFSESCERPLRYSASPATLKFELEYLQTPTPKLFLKPTIRLDEEVEITPDQAVIFECARPGLIYEKVYYRFQPGLKRKHLRSLEQVAGITIPEPLFGTFVENGLPELQRFAEVSNQKVIENFVTLPFVEAVKGWCEISYLDGELEASLFFLYGKVRLPSTSKLLEYQHVDRFVTGEGILARNLAEEQKIIQSLFREFTLDEEHGTYTLKSEKKIVQFMTEVVPANQKNVEFDCPQNLLDQFIYDDSTFTLNLSEGKQAGAYLVELEVVGQLQGVTVDLLWECISSRKAYIELERPEKRGRGRRKGAVKPHKILVLDLDRLAPVVQIFDEIGISTLDSHKEHRPLWSLASIKEGLFDGLPINFQMSDGLKEIQDQILGLAKLRASAVPKSVQATLRGYQTEGVHWMERLRHMYLNGILADDMGLGKTVQAIVAVTQYKEAVRDTVSIVVCPTSLTYNWKEEFHKFHPGLNVKVIDGTPTQRKKALKDICKYDVIVTSYSLIQKDVETYQQTEFGYVILDEAQHIKNRSTRNAKSVKLLRSRHRLILTGTPIENSLDELWSLFDFLMPGLLSSYERFCEKYIRGASKGDELSSLKRKVSPFILRRMKEDVLKELPPVSELVYHCELSDVQRELYTSYARSAREELSRLVKKEGFDRVQIHVLATLTRLKQICCHPAIFAKDDAARGDSAKYEMLLELLETLMDGGHKTVIFSQYTRMLQLMRDDFAKMGVRFCYLDGSSKNRMEIVKNFNEDKAIPVFLVSLKAGGSGLNLTGADTVIHYDMWWNPAVENQATDRVHRIGQTQNVSSYKLVTLGTIEEKIVEMQNRKKGLVKKVVSDDDEAMAKLTWDEVLELLQT